MGTDGGWGDAAPFKPVLCEEAATAEAPSGEGPAAVGGAGVSGRCCDACMDGGTTINGEAATDTEGPRGVGAIATSADGAPLRLPMGRGGLALTIGFAAAGDSSAEPAPAAVEAPPIGTAVVGLVSGGGGGPAAVMRR